MPRQHAPGSASTSDSELDVEDEEEPEMTPAVLAVMMPTDERGKALYNAVQAVWSPRNKAASVEKVKSGIALFGETVKTLRDAWKAKNEALKKAELPNAPTAANVLQLKNDVANYRQLMEGAMARSLQYAHPSILKRYVSNPDPNFPCRFRLLASASCQVKCLASVKWHSMKTPNRCAFGGGCMQALAAAIWCFGREIFWAVHRSATTLDSFAAFNRRDCCDPEMNTPLPNSPKIFC